MSAKTVFEIRLELAQGHWDIGEYDDAMRCLERALESASAPLDPRLADLAWTLANGLTHYVGDVAAEGLRTRLTRVAEAASPPEEAAPVEPPDSELAAWPEPAAPELEEPRSTIATPTLAELLASQGHHDQALRVADAALARNPSDPRALAVRQSLEAPALHVEPEAQAPETTLDTWPDPGDPEPLRVDSGRLESLGVQTPELPNPEPLGPEPLGPEPLGPEPLGSRDDAHVIAELERWLLNLERDRSLHQAEGSVRA